MSGDWLDRKLIGPPEVQVNGTAVPRSDNATVPTRRRAINFTGGGANATDNPGNNSVDIQAGPGGGVIGTRVAPDADDTVVYTLQEASAPFANTGSGPGLSLQLLGASNPPLARASGLVLPYAAGFQAVNNPTLSTTQSSFSDRTTLFVTSTPTFTCSFWVKVFGPNYTNSSLEFIAKHEAATGQFNEWSSPYVTFQMSMPGNQSPGGAVNGYLKGVIQLHDLGGSTFGVQAACLGFGEWHHVGMAVAIVAVGGGLYTMTQNLFCDGALVAQLVRTSNVAALELAGRAVNSSDGLNGGPIIVGANTSASENTPDCLMHDIRLSDTIARGAAYFRTVYRSGMGLPLP